MPQDAHKETLGFQAEVTQLLHLMVHSLYSNKEIFLRELISNASDAIDRLRFAALSEKALYEQDAELAIHIAYDKEAKTITVADNGVGMTRQEVIDNIGTIAKSGTREFLQSLTGDQQKDANLIGQFGVGFYSSFIVADRVTLLTRHAGEPADQAVRWESNGEGEYSLESIEKADRGTKVILHIREDDADLLSGWRLRDIIRKYSDHIVVPILMPTEEKDQTGEEQVNRASALWARPKSEITPEEYNELFHHIGHDTGDPLAYIHSRMEGNYEYILLLYIPARAPFDLWNRNERHGVKLYIRRVFIMDDAEQLMPGYLRFVRGIVDSNDLPLNISREILQHNRMIDTMRANATKKILGLLTEMAANDPEKYATFWQEFGRVFKEGVGEDQANRDTIASLLRFATTRSGSEAQEVALDTYIERMKEGQDKIYYITADTYAGAKESPLLEIFQKKGIEVLLLSDPIDFFIGPELGEYKGKTLQSISKGEMDLEKIADEQGATDGPQEEVGDMSGLITRLKGALGDQVKDVRVTNRLTTSPACLVVDEHDFDPSLQRLLKAVGQKIPTTKPILEINPHHAIIQRMDQESDRQRFDNWASVLFDQSVLSLGEQLENPTRFVNRLNELLASM